MPRTWRAGGIIGPTTAKQNAGAGGVEVARKILEADAAAGGSSTKAFDPCLDTGEVGEGPAVGEVEEPGVESPVDGRVRAVRDIAA